MAGRQQGLESLQTQPKKTPQDRFPSPGVIGNKTDFHFHRLSEFPSGEHRSPAWCVGTPPPAPPPAGHSSVALGVKDKKSVFLPTTYLLHLCP